MPSSFALAFAIDAVRDEIARKSQAGQLLVNNHSFYRVHCVSLDSPNTVTCRISIRKQGPGIADGELNALSEPNTLPIAQCICDTVPSRGFPLFGMPACDIFREHNA